MKKYCEKCGTKLKSGKSKESYVYSDDKYDSNKIHAMKYSIHILWCPNNECHLDFYNFESRFISAKPVILDKYKREIK